MHVEEGLQRRQVTGAERPVVRSRYRLVDALDIDAQCREWAMHTVSCRLARCQLGSRRLQQAHGLAPVFNWIFTTEWKSARCHSRSTAPALPHGLAPLPAPPPPASFCCELAPGAPWCSTTLSPSSRCPRPRTLLTLCCRRRSAARPLWSTMVRGSLEPVGRMHAYARE